MGRPAPSGFAALFRPVSLLVSSWFATRLSKRAVLVRPFVGHRFFDEAVELPRCRIGFDLTIPGLGIELREPAPKERELLRRKVLYQQFELLDRAHDPPPMQSQKLYALLLQRGEAISVHT